MQLHPEKLQWYPTHAQLMNRVAAALPTKWRIIGIQLGLSVAKLDEIESYYPQDCKRCYSSMFSHWESLGPTPFSWTTVMDALKSDLVEENVFAARLEEDLKEHGLSEM